MAKVLTEKIVKKAVIKCLSRLGYNRYLKAKESGEHGIDIKVRHYKYARYFLVEVKGDPNPKTYKSPAAGREVSFNYVLGQILSRMKYKALYKYGIGLPESYSDKIFRRLPWVVCKKLRLYIFLVNKDEKVKYYSWKDLKKAQTKNSRK